MPREYWLPGDILSDDDYGTGWNDDYDDLWDNWDEADDDWLILNGGGMPGYAPVPDDDYTDADRKAIEADLFRDYWKGKDDA